MLEEVVLVVDVDVDVRLVEVIVLEEVDVDAEVDVEVLELVEVVVLDVSVVVLVEVVVSDVVVEVVTGGGGVVNVGVSVLRPRIEVNEENVDKIGVPGIPDMAVRGNMRKP